MNNEQKYKEALEKARKLCAYPTTQPFISDLQDLFPELKESEDERIVKCLLNYFHHVRYNGLDLKGTNVDEVIAWLEKQNSNVDNANKEYWRGYREGKQEILDKYAWLEKKGGQKSADKAEPKFKVGDWIIDKQELVHQIKNVVENVTNHTFRYDIVGGGYFNDNSDVRLWSIEDAKEGDMLVSVSNHPFIYNGKFTERTVGAYCGLNVYGEFLVNKFPERCTWTDNKDIRPASKEQRDILLKEMHRVNYEWDTEKKELKKIEQTIEIPFGGKDSELQEATYYIPDGYHAEINGNEVVIKKGKQNTTWKPTEKQINAIRLARSFVTDDFGNNPTLSEVLKELEEQLKTL